MSPPSSVWTSTARSTRWMFRSGRPERGSPRRRPSPRKIIAAGVGEQVPIPVGEAVEALEAGHHLGAGPQHQVVRVPEHDSAPRDFQVGGRQRPHWAPAPQPA